MAMISNPNLFFKQLIVSSLNAPKRAMRNCFCAGSSLRSFSNNKRLSDTSIMLQSGADIQELPLVVKKLSGVDVGHILFCQDISDERNSCASAADVVHGLGAIPHREEIAEIIAGFDRCNTILEVLKLLEVLPSAYVEPAVAFRIIKKMCELDEQQSLRNERMGEDVIQNFTTTAVFNQLIGTILSNDDGTTLINCLKLINQHSLFGNYFEPYREKLTEKIMVNVTKNAYSISELCDIAEEFHICGYTDEVDKLWIGFTENVKSIDVSNVLNVFHVLPYFRASRNVVLKILLERMTDIWWYMEGHDVIELLTVMKNAQIHSQQLMQMMGRWLNTKIHAVDEDQLLSIVKVFGNLKFINTQVIAALERYVKIRLYLITNPNLLAAIMEYCDQFKVRSPLILENVCDYFISKGESLSPTIIRSLFVPFGTLHFAPTRSYEFWKMTEHVLEQKFTRFKPEHVVDMMLSCIFLEKYPINLVNYVFNPHFLTRLQNSSGENWPTVKNNLVLFDHYMSSHCPSYKGPLLPREMPQSLFIVDRQLKQVLSNVKSILSSEYGHEYRFKVSKILACCPLDHRCMIDIYMRPRLSAKPHVAVLIHRFEEFAFCGTELLGSQQLRIRHFTDMGIKVVGLNYLQVVANSAKKGDLAKYLRESIDAVLKID